ncbi:hypothetical protein G9444_1159 [Rhodococcus erythropolis]|uniref:Uncharacterized protein n=1 Tax=Rhodococcus erythropolis TaxID=1833 RepID=A0A6G9CMY8_RHOER|nr:hypothetical protein G9444_1159 [Rhodococcus erythropolis]
MDAFLITAGHIDGHEAEALDPGRIEPETFGPLVGTGRCRRPELRRLRLGR